MSNILKPKNEKISQYKLYGFDIETYGKYNLFLMGSIVNETEKYIFWNKKQMQDFILQSKIFNNSVLFATNLSFDFLALFGDDFELFSQFDYTIRGSEIINISIDKNKNKINFRDTFNFLKCSVHSLGKILGIPKMPKPKFIGNKPKNEIERKQLELYNVNDSYISFKFADFLQNSFNKIGTNLKYTIASTSMSLFQNKYLKTFIIQNDKKVIKELYNGYYGGRTEVFKRGLIKNCYLYDINSLYPYVMQKYQFPNPSTLKIINNPDKSVFKYEGLSLCEIETPKDLNIPLLPFRNTDKLIFLLGKFTNYQTHIEIRKAIELGYKIKPIKSFVYTKTFNPFKDFVTDLYKKRMIYKKENNNMQIVFKILSNSLYGKFAQRLEQPILFFVNSQESKNKINKYIQTNIQLFNEGLPEKYKIDTPDKRTIIVNGICYDEPRIYYITDLDKQSFPYFINPILSIYITSIARIELYKLFEKVKKLKGDVLYCDTDSVITNIKLNTSENIGDIKMEYEIEKGLIIKPKFYYIKTKEQKDIYKTKGISNFKVYDNETNKPLTEKQKQQNKQKTFDNFSELLINKKITYTKFTKMKESLRRGFKFNEKINVLKEIDLNDNKRIWKEKNINLTKLENSEPIIIE